MTEYYIQSQDGPPLVIEAEGPEQARILYLTLAGEDNEIIQIDHFEDGELICDSF